MPYDSALPRHDRGPLPEGRDRKDDARAERSPTSSRRVGLQVLPIDLDPQGNLSDYFDVDPDASPTMGDVLAGRARAVEAVHNGLIPANLGLAEAELVLGGKMGRELTLKRALRDARREYDLHPHRLSTSARAAHGERAGRRLHHALISAEAEYFSLQGVEQVLEVMELARQNLNEDLEWLGVVLNIADLRTLHARETLKHVAAELRRQDLPDASCGSRSDTRSQPSAGSRSSTTARPWRATTSIWSTSCSSGSGATAPASV